MQNLPKYREAAQLRTFSVAIASRVLFPPIICIFLGSEHASDSPSAREGPGAAEGEVRATGPGEAEVPRYRSVRFLCHRVYSPPLADALP